MHLLSFKNLKQESAITHFSSTRLGGVSQGAFESLNLGLHTEDNTKAITKNIHLLCSHLGIASNQLHNARQAHGKEIKIIDKNFLSLSNEERTNSLDGYDALITNIQEQYITVTTADCVPVLLFDKKENAIAAIHSGWRSSLENIISETIKVMNSLYGSHPNHIIAAIGACISEEYYEVGEELPTLFASREYPIDTFFRRKENSKYLFNIRKLVASQLQNMGVKNIEISPFCTYQDEDLFFSARRLGNRSGRMLTGIMLS